MASLITSEESFPLESFKDLINWNPVTNILKITPFLPRPTVYGPKVMLVHDMKGGYRQDRFNKGCHNYNPRECYGFAHWRNIDSFVYFSHARVTIPPYMWVEAAHRNNVKIFGTIITEHQLGVQENKYLIHNGVEAIKSLVNIALHHKLDGWFLNFEAPFDAKDVPSLIQWIKSLREALKLHVKHGEVIWYDSVILTGELKWQDRLNEFNSPFFDVADGFFSNYTWKKDFPKISKSNAGSRQWDVYTGCDIFGRGTFGGGGFSTLGFESCSNDTSIGIFAPGWTLESIDESEILVQELFLKNEDKFWHGLNCSVKSRPIVLSLPFSCDFINGFYNNCFNLSFQSIGIGSLAGSCTNDGLKIPLGVTKLFDFYDSESHDVLVACSVKLHDSTKFPNFVLKIESSGNMFHLTSDNCYTTFLYDDSSVFVYSIPQISIRSVEFESIGNYSLILKKFCIISCDDCAYALTENKIKIAEIFPYFNFSSLEYESIHNVDSQNSCLYDVAEQVLTFPAMFKNEIMLNNNEFYVSLRNNGIKLGSNVRVKFSWEIISQCVDFYDIYYLFLNEVSELRMFWCGRLYGNSYVLELPTGLFIYVIPRDLIGTGGLYSGLFQVTKDC